MDELRLRLLGGLVVEGLAAKDVGSRKARALLAALALERGGALSADALAQIVWGEVPPARPQEQLGVLVSRLRGVLGAHRILRHDAGYQLTYDWLDLDELDAWSASAAARLRAGDGLSARLSATMAFDLVRGRLLPEEDGTWVEGPRAVVDRTVAAVRLVGAEAALATGDPIGALAAASAALDHDGYDEAALRAVMRAHAAMGRPAAALAAYAAARARLVDDLGVGPGPETEALHGAILQGEPAPTPAAAPGRGAAASPSGERWDPLVQRARQELAATDLDSARRDADEAVRRGGGPGAMELAGWVAYYQRDFAAALRCAEDAAARTDQEERRASCLTLAGRIRHSRGDLAAADAWLQEAVSSSVAGVRNVGEVWLGNVRAHQGRPDEAIELAARGATDSAAMRHPFVIPQACFARAYAQGQRGDVQATLDELQHWEAVLDELGAAGRRYRPVVHNFWAWVLGATGRPDESARRSEAALAESGQLQEARAHALFDLAAAAVSAGQLATAQSWLDQAEVPPDDHGAMAWHQRQRLWLLRGRLALHAGDADLAAELAARTVADAERRGSARARWQAVVVLHLAGAARGVAPDPVEVDEVLRHLDHLAGLEAWRSAAELAAATEREQLWQAAAHRADSLAATAGPDAGRLASWLDAELARLGRP